MIEPSEIKSTPPPFIYVAKSTTTPLVPTVRPQSVSKVAIVRPPSVGAIMPISMPLPVYKTSTMPVYKPPTIPPPMPVYKPPSVSMMPLPVYKPPTMPLPSMPVYKPPPVYKAPPVLPPPMPVQVYKPPSVSMVPTSPVRPRSPSKISVSKVEVKRSPSPRISPVASPGETCCVCMSESVPRSKRLVCSHAVCQDCIGNLQKNECPVCRRGLEGGYVTDETLATIVNREEQAKANEESANYLTAQAMQQGRSSRTNYELYQAQH